MRDLQESIVASWETADSSVSHSEDSWDLSIIDVSFEHTNVTRRLS